MVRGSICRGSGTGTTYNGTGTHMQYTIGTSTKQTGTGTPKQQSTSSLLVRYHTYWYRYHHVIFTRFEHNSNLGARVRLSFDHHFEITNEKGI